jgi:hypothetical protein
MSITPLKLSRNVPALHKCTYVIQKSFGLVFKVTNPLIKINMPSDGSVIFINLHYILIIEITTEISRVALLYISIGICFSLLVYQSITEEVC